MKITTNTGSVYTIKRGICQKSKDGYVIDTFKVWVMKQNKDVEAKALMLPWQDGEQWETISRPTIGRHMYVAGKDVWWITTPVVSVEDEEDE